MIVPSQINPMDVALQANGSVTISGQTAAHLVNVRDKGISPLLMNKNDGCVNEGCSGGGTSNSSCANVLCSG
jgi:hypothetical protein